MYEIFWRCATETSKPLAYTRPCSSEFCSPYWTNLPLYKPRVAILKKLLELQLN